MSIPAAAAAADHAFATPWVRHVLRFAMSAGAATPAPWDTNDGAAWETRAGGGGLADPDDPGKDPRFRKLVEAILYSRWFCNTYNLVLMGVLVVFTAWHWSEKIILRWRKRRVEARSLAGNSAKTRTEDGEEEAWSSSSSTISGTGTPPSIAKQHNADERTALLPSTRRKIPTSLLWKPYTILQATLEYQPPPLPLLHKTLPNNATSLLVLAFLALTLFYNLHAMPLSFTYLFVLADRCGILFTANLPVLYLLAAKNQPLHFLTGYSYESLNILHRRVGEVVCLEAFIHFAGMVGVWWGLLRHLGFTLARFVLNRVVLCGLGAIVAYEVIYFTSLGSFRKRWYEVFLATHIVLQVAGLVFLWFHHHTSRPYVGVSLAIFLVDRLVYRLWLRSSTHPATLTILEDDETLLVSATWAVVPTSTLVPGNMKNGWTPNQHIFISVPALGRTHALQTHPFTIFSAAPTTMTDEHDKHAWLTLLIRAQSPTGFTHALLDHARTHPTTRIRLDGPYGSSHALDLLESSSTAILVAGGSGIAVAYPLLYSLLCPTPSNTDTESATPTPRARNVKLLWITHAPSHRLWIPEPKLKELEDWGLDVVICPPTKFAGRPDVGGIVGEWIEEGGGGGTGVVVSGPEGLVRDVRNTVAGGIWRGRRVGVCVEKFGW